MIIIRENKKRGMMSIHGVVITHDRSHVSYGALLRFVQAAYQYMHECDDLLCLEGQHEQYAR